MLPSPSQNKGKLYIVGTGPGRSDQMTVRAREAIAKSVYVVGNQIYLDNVSDLLDGKEIVSSSMGREVQRARKAVELAQENTVSIVSGGDAGVYGMASIVLEIVERSFPGTVVEIVPGITAASAAASLLGSPLSSDFMIISLSDLLTPWGEIERRLEASFGLGVPVVLYNPKSLRRPDNLHTALSIARKHLPDQTPIGIVKNAYRSEESVTVTNLGSLAENDEFVDMHSTVVVGGLDSRVWMEGENVRGIITPRGYDRKYVY